MWTLTPVIAEATTPPTHATNPAITNHNDPHQICQIWHDIAHDQVNSIMYCAMYDEIVQCMMKL